METATRRYSTYHYWNLVKDMDDSQKLELVTMLADSVQTAVAKDVKMAEVESSLKPYTAAELHARISQAEHESALGLGQDSDAMFDELEEEFAREEQSLEMAGAT